MSRDKHRQNLQCTPLVAILRGLQPRAALETVRILVDSGIRAVEVPLNSPRPFASIESIASHFGDSITVGAGTVLNEHEVEQVAIAGGEIVLSPNVDSAVVRRALQLGLEPVPGIATASEGFAAVKAGARLLKVFPAASVGTGFFRQLPAVLPRDCRLLAVGGVDLGNAREFLTAGATAVGLGAALFRPEMDAGELSQRAMQFVRLCTAGIPVPD